MKSLASFLLLMFVAVPAHSQNVEEINRKADEAYKNEDYKTALKYIDQALENDPGSADLLIFRTTVLVKLKDFPEAVNTANLAVKHNPTSDNVYNKRAGLFSRAGFYEGAIADYTLAIRYAEDDTAKYHYHTNRAATEFLYRHFEKAYKDLMIAYAFDSTDVVMLSNLAMVCDGLKEYDEALKYIFRVRELDPDFNSLNSNIGFIYQNKGEHEKAIEYLDKSIEKDPNEAYGYNNRAYSKMKTGDLKGAMTDVEISLKLMPSNAYAYRNRALIWIEMGKIKKACEDLQTAIDKGFLEQFGPEAAELQSKYCR